MKEIYILLPDRDAEWDRAEGWSPGEKAKDLKGALGKILRYMGKYKIAVVFVMIIAACSTVFSVLGPKVLGKATTGLAERSDGKSSQEPAALIFPI